MKKQLFLLFLLVVITFTVVAQNRKIQFEEGNWQSILNKAQKNKKIIFIDCYATWCGPCKMLDKNVFTNDAVADYFNKNFINYKSDMEKGEGVTLAKKFAVRAYPTMIFLNDKGEILHTVVGYRNPQQLIEEAQKVVK